MTTMTFTLMELAASQRENELRHIARSAWRRPRRSGRGMFAWTRRTRHAIDNPGHADVPLPNVQAPGGFDRRIGLGPVRTGIPV